jgi:DNA invertase Pin-like site-specific DNA recombinase
VLVGYARVSTVMQDLETQIGKLTALGVDPKRIYTDKGFTGKNMTRDGLEKALAACRAGDTLIVPSLDRLARNALDTLEIIKELGEREVILSNNGMVYDPKDPMAKMIFTMLASVAEAEGGWISLRTKEAMARPSVRRKLRGRQPKLTPKQDAAVALHFADPKTDISEIATMFNISRSSVYRAVERHTRREAAAIDAIVEPSKSGA